ncbi:three component ABC system middle component [Sphingopyxis sp. R3-92]|uniref:three component ABC system middle component n=1 Tax=Sphingopyxis sp. R3-92 TaxID=3158553 RepID=UPI003EE6597D
MRQDHEELVLRNPALGATAFWHFSGQFGEHARGAPPVLPHFYIAMAILHHRASVDKLHRMQFDSGIMKAVADQPHIIAGLQQRLEAHAPLALSALQLGTSSGLLLREGGPGFPSYRAVGAALPSPIRQAEGGTSRIYGAARRLGAFFAADPLPLLSRHLMIEF